MGRTPKRKKVQNAPPQESRQGKGRQNNIRNFIHLHTPNDKPGVKYVSSPGRPLQTTKSLPHQPAYQETVHVNCSQRNTARSPSRPGISRQTLTEHASVKPRQVSNVHCSRPETNNSSSQVTQTRDDTIDIPKGKRKRRRRSRSLKSKDVQNQEQIPDKSQSKILVSKQIESSQTKPTIYYAIRNGAYSYYGVHTDWNVCVRYLKGAPGANFKSFTDEDEAFEFAHGDYHEVTPPPPPPTKKLKREEPRQPANARRTDWTTPRIEKRKRQKDPRSRQVELSTGRRRQHQQPTRIEPRPEVKLPSLNGLLSRDPQPLPLKVEDDSVEEADEPQTRPTSRQISHVPSSERSSEVQCVEDVSLQTWKVEPVLLPTTLFTSEARRAPVKTMNDVKKEVLPIQIGARKDSGEPLR